MTNKYKISEIAKDFKITSKQVIAIISEKTGAEKKSGAALEEVEIALIFDTLTRQNEVKSFKAYFSTGEESRAAAKKAREDEKNKKLAEQMAILEQLKAAAQAEEAKKKPAEKKTETKTAVKAKPEADAAAKEEKPAEKKTAKKTEPKEEKKHGVSDPRPFVSQKKDKKPGEAPKRGPAEILHVDTRTSNVNIERYNEKYERIAPANTMRDNFSRKQKIKQKSQDYRRPQGVKRDTEADKIRRMQLERIKKTPVTVTVGDEITVGELAAAMK